MDVFTFGETMALFTPTNNGKMKFAEQYVRKYGGAESNMAIGLTRLGHKAAWFSKVGDDELGKGMLHFIRGEGVDVSQVLSDGDAPTGIYFKEIINAEKVRVYYYRKGSAASRMSPEAVNEEYISQAKYILFSGITPALSDSCYELIKQVIAIGKKYKLPIIFDPNLRRKLWSEEKARSILLEIIEQVDMVFLGLEEGQFLFGHDDYIQFSQQMIKQGASLVVVKLGADGAYYASAKEAKRVSPFPVKAVIDPVGAGDGFNAGVISGLLDGVSLEEAVRRGNAVGAMVVQVNGDVEGLPEREELEEFMGGYKTDVNR